MWVVTFGTLLSAVYIIRIPLQRALQKKVIATTKYVLWSSWGDNVTTESLSQTNVRMKVEGSQNQEARLEEKQGRISTRLCPDLNWRNETRVSASVEENQEALLGLFDIN